MHMKKTKICLLASFFLGLSLLLPFTASAQEGMETSGEESALAEEAYDIGSYPSIDEVEGWKALSERDFTFSVLNSTDEQIGNFLSGLTDEEYDNLIYESENVLNQEQENGEPLYIRGLSAVLPRISLFSTGTEDSVRVDKIEDEGKKTGYFYLVFRQEGHKDYYAKFKATVPYNIDLDKDNLELNKEDKDWVPSSAGPREVQIELAASGTSGTGAAPGIQGMALRNLGSAEKAGISDNTVKQYIDNNHLYYDSNGVKLGSNVSKLIYEGVGGNKNLRNVFGWKENGKLKICTLHTGSYSNGTYNHWNQLYFGITYNLDAFQYITSSVKRYRNTRDKDGYENIISSGSGDGKIYLSGYDDSAARNSSRAKDWTNGTFAKVVHKGDDALNGADEPDTNNRGIQSSVLAYINDTGLAVDYKKGGTTVFTLKTSTQKLVLKDGDKNYKDPVVKKSGASY